MRVVVDPVAYFDGRCDQPNISEDPESGKCVVTIEAASHWGDVERRPGRHTNHEEQQLHFAGDRFFDRADKQQEQLIWGKETAESRAKYPPRFVAPASQPEGQAIQNDGVGTSAAATGGGFAPVSVPGLGEIPGGHGPGEDRE